MSALAMTDAVRDPGILGFCVLPVGRKSRDILTEQLDPSGLRALGKMNKFRVVREKVVE